MGNNWVRATALDGTVNIEARFSLEETVHKLSAALALAFVEEQTGEYEEYPAYVAEGTGLKFVLLGIPLPEYDLREDKSPKYQLMVASLSEGEGDEGHRIEVSAFYARFIEAKTELKCEAAEFPATS